MVDAYVLISTEPGLAPEVYEKVKDLESVLNVEAVTGPYDLIVKIEVNSSEDLAETVFNEVRGMSGITNTSTLTVVEL